MICQIAEQNRNKLICVRLKLNLPRPMTFTGHTNMNRFWILAVVAFSFSLGYQSASADNWPQFRGPNFDAVSPQKLPTTWSDVDGKTENIRWKIPVDGEGWSQPIVWDNQIFMTAAVPTGVVMEKPEVAEPEPQQGGRRKNRNSIMLNEYRYDVVCLDADSGNEKWRRTVKTGQPPIPRHETNTYATETPITDGQHIYAYFGMNGVYCLDMNGEVIWQKDLGVYEMRAGWGTSSSPALAGDKLFIQVDNEVASFLVALDAKNGEEIWRVSRDEKSQYSSPMIWKNSLREELIVGGMVYRSYEPATGKLLWELDMSKGRSSATPVATKDHLYVGNEFRARGGADDGGGFLFSIKPGGSGDITPEGDATNSEFIQWKVERADMEMASPTICDGNLYLFERNSSKMHCLNVETGKTVYRKRVSGATSFWASPWTDGSHVFALESGGTTIVLAPGDDFKIVSKNVLNQQAWGTPALADGRIYLRTVDNLYCIEDKDSPAQK